MTLTTETPGHWQTEQARAWIAAAILVLLLGFQDSLAGQNLLKNPGFEEDASGSDNPSNWSTRTGSEGRALLTDKETHAGLRSIAIPANTAVEQKVDSASSGAYLARCWIKSEAEQTVTFLLQDADSPWSAYTCAETKVPRGQWVQLEAFCALDRAGTLILALGGLSKESRMYHGTEGVMASPIVADDFELIRFEPKPPSGLAPLAVWDTKEDLTGPPDWSRKDPWSTVKTPGQTFLGTPVLQGRHLAGVVRKSDGGLVVYSIRGDVLNQQCVLVPSPVLPSPKCTMVQAEDRVGIRVTSEAADRSYTAWFTPQGVITVQAKGVQNFQISDCRLRYGLLPSFAGSDICYSPAKMPAAKAFSIPSTQWFVGLADGNDSMLVAVWESGSQAVSLGLSGERENRLIESLSIATEQTGFSLSFVEHDHIWHREPLKEDWLGEYVPIAWERPFPARWMSHFFVTPGGRPSFREPFMNYSFPVAYAKTRMWGVWFEDWNHYPFYFDGRRTVFHFEKSFIPKGEALIYFLEPAAADLFSPCEIVEQVLGPEKAAALFDLDANRLRRLKYSTPDQFMYDRPVCATTTRLSKVKQDEKPTVGVHLATHLYEFIREIRGRVDQYVAFFGQIKSYLATETKAHPDLRNYTAGLEAVVAEAESRSEEIYATPLPSVEKKIESMKKLLQEGKGDGFECGNLDVRDTAGAQDDLCRRYNRQVLRLMQTAALDCGDSAEKAVIAKYIWDQSRAVLRLPTRWESRRTLYFFEP
jgi:hypothetical protein